MTICNPIFWIYTDKVIDSDDFYLASGMLFTRFHHLLTPCHLKRLIHELVMDFFKVLRETFNFALLLIKRLTEVVSQASFCFQNFVLNVIRVLRNILLQIVNFLLEHFNMKFQLLFDFNMTTHFSFTNLELAFVLKQHVV